MSLTPDPSPKGEGSEYLNNKLKNQTIMAQIVEGSTALFIGAKNECEELAATMQQAGIKNLNVEEL